jgi:hypothetical protein
MRNANSGPSWTTARLHQKMFGLVLVSGVTWQQLWKVDEERQQEVEVEEEAVVRLVKRSKMDLDRIKGP